MTGSLIIVGVFLLGCLFGYAGWYPDVLLNGNIELIVLYLLMFQVGMSVGSDKKLKEILRSIRPRLLLVPLATIIGSLLFAALASLAMGRWSLTDCLAIGSGFGYYSLSSIFITEYKGAEMGTVALLANIVRELITLLAAPLLVRWFGRLAPIAAGGATTADTTLPIITQTSGQDLAVVSIFHGFAVDFSVPFLVTLWCSI